MSGIGFISNDSSAGDSQEFERIALALVAPRPYVAKNPLWDHMYNAIEPALIDLIVCEYVNLRSGKEFDCIAYYADDPYAIAFCAAHDDLYLAAIGAPFVRRLVKICNREFSAAMRESA